MFAPQVMFNPAPAQIRPGKRIGDGAVPRNDADVTRAIDEDAIAGKKFVDFIELRNEIVEKFLELRDECFRADPGSGRRRGCRK